MGVIAIVAMQLANVKTFTALFTLDVNTCYLGPQITNAGLCSYAIAVGGWRAPQDCAAPPHFRVQAGAHPHSRWLAGAAPPHASPAAACLH